MQILRDIIRESPGLMSKSADVSAAIDGALAQLYASAARLGPMNQSELAGVAGAIKAAVMIAIDGAPHVKEDGPGRYEGDGVGYFGDNKIDNKDLPPFNAAGDKVGPGGVVIAAVDVEGGKVSEKGTRSTTLEVGAPDPKGGITTGAGAPDPKGERSPQATEVVAKGNADPHPETRTVDKIDAGGGKNLKPDKDEPKR